MKVFQIVKSVSYEGERVVGVFSSLELANAAVREVYAHADDYNVGYDGEASELFTNKSSGGLYFHRNDSGIQIRCMELDVDFSTFTDYEQRWESIHREVES